MEAQDKKADSSYVDSMERQLRAAISEQASCIAERVDKQSLQAVRDTHQQEIQCLHSQLQALSAGMSRLDDRVRFLGRTGAVPTIILLCLCTFLCGLCF